jgi:hypothetical protein
MVEQSARTLASPTGWRDPRSLRNHHDIEQHLALLTRRENELSVALDEVLNDRTKLDASISRLAALSPKVRDLARQVDGESLSSYAGDESNRQLLPVFDEFSDDGSDAEELGLVERVRKVWVTSERVGGKVRKLDVEVSRVKEASERVQEVLELKVSQTARHNTAHLGLSSPGDLFRVLCNPFVRLYQKVIGNWRLDVASVRWT